MGVSRLSDRRMHMQWILGPSLRREGPGDEANSAGINTGGTPGFPPPLKIAKYYISTYCRV